MITLREVLAPDAADPLVFSTAQEKGCVMVTCNRNDFLELAAQLQHHGLIILIRRRTARNECINCSVFWSKPAQQASPATSTLPDASLLGEHQLSNDGFFTDITFQRITQRSPFCFK